MTVDPSWQLLVALIALLGLGLLSSTVGRLGKNREIVLAAVRAVLQLALVSTIILWAVKNLWSTGLFVLLMFSVAVYTTAKRVDALARWPWVAVAVASGIIPVLTIVFGVGVVPFEGVSIISISGIIIGNAMTGHTLVGRRCFAELSTNIPSYEAALALGMRRSQAIDEITLPVAAEALLPNLDQTRTVGLVTLPGAYIGVLLGGGTPLQAGAAQALVLIGVMATQTCVIIVARLLMAHGKLLTPGLTAKLHE